MAKKKTETKEAEKPATEQAAQEPQSKGEVALSGTLRLPYPTRLGEEYGFDRRTWSVFIDAVWPSAKTLEGVAMALAYCKARQLDPLKKMVHIVPMYSRTLQREVETVWPSIAEVRITATRTGVYAGKDAAAFGPEITKKFQHVDERNDAVKNEKEVTFPEWCMVTVYKIVQGVRCQFVGPKVYWEETYATENRFSDVPNEMWADRRSGQLEKCAEAAALRAAFPEELGNEYVAEEMHGQTIEGQTIPQQASPVVTPPRPKKSEFERHDQPQAEQQKTPEPEVKKAAEPKKEAQPEPKPKVEEAKEPEEETPLARGARLLARMDTVRDVADLRETIIEELDGMEQAKEWGALCDARSKEIADGKK